MSETLYSCLVGRTPVDSGKGRIMTSDQMTWMISRNAHEMDVEIEGEEQGRSEADVVEDLCGLLGDENLNRQRGMSPGVGDMSRENQ